VEDLLKRADLAMYRAKDKGRNTLCFFDPQMQAVVTASAALHADLSVAVAMRQLDLLYQAQVDASRRVIGAEALLRWQRPGHGLVLPTEFISAAEQSGLIIPIGQWVLVSACEQLSRWAALPGLAHVSVAVNISARQFHHPDFVSQVIAALDSTGANPQRLKLELTESLLVDDMEEIITKMTTLKAHGIGFSLDDFGTGYSSLAYLKRLPLDQLKNDQGFVRDILTDSNDAAISKMVIVLADSLGLEVIAEGVETEAQMNFLAKQGCNAYQGYLFSRPTPPKDLEELIRRNSYSHL
jgi:EAL domain-containing protein (putative c-di-GMP-specific phosphodiesterase class I)